MSLRAIAALGLAARARRLRCHAGRPSWAPRRRCTSSTPEERDVDFPLRIYDPWEGTNRGIYKFNALFDEYVFLPVVRAYEFVTPDFIEDRVTRLLLQPDRVPQRHQRPDAGAARCRRPGGDPAGAQLDDRRARAVRRRDAHGRDPGAARFRADPRPLGRRRTGPISMVPVLGPSNVRDFSGFVVDSVIASDGAAANRSSPTGSTSTR